MTYLHFVSVFVSIFSGTLIFMSALSRINKGFIDNDGKDLRDMYLSMILIFAFAVTISLI